MCTLSLPSPDDLSSSAPLDRSTRLTLNGCGHSVPVYFIAGLQYDAGRFWIFFAIYLLANLLSIAIVYVICLASPNITLANALAALVFTLYSNLAGFLITRDNIPGWWIWAHYLDLDMYGIESLLINEVVRPPLPLLSPKLCNN
jgi:ABC-type multidrug transport system permease subunit